MSIVSDAKGETVVFHHGTYRSFDAFDVTFVGSGMTDSDEPEAGFFFTPIRDFALRYAEGPKGEIVRVHLNVDRPYRVTGEMWGRAQGLAPREARDAGYDAYVVTPYDEGDMWIVFDPGRITVVGREPIGATSTPIIQTM